MEDRSLRSKEKGIHTKWRRWNERKTKSIYVFTSTAAHVCQSYIRLKSVITLHGVRHGLHNDGRKMKNTISLGGPDRCSHSFPLFCRRAETLAFLSMKRTPSSLLAEKNLLGSFTDFFFLICLFLCVFVWKFFLFLASLKLMPLMFTIT